MEQWVAIYDVHNVRMDDRLITMAPLALLVVTLGGAVYFFVLFKLAKRDARRAVKDRDGALEEAERERQYRFVAENRLEAVNGHVEEILHGTPYKAPSRLWRLKGFGWLAGLITGAWAAARTAQAPGGAATAAVSVKTAVVGAVAVAAAAGGITYAVHIAHDPPERPSTNAIAAAPPRATQPKALPAPSAQAAAPAETPEAATSTSDAIATPTTTPTTTTAATPTVTPRTPPASTTGGTAATPATTADAAVTTPAAPAAPAGTAPEVAVTPSVPMDAPNAKPDKGKPGHVKDAATPPDAVPTTPAGVTPAETDNVHQAQHLLCVAVHRPLDVLDLCV